MDNNPSLNANRFRHRGRPPTYGQLIERILRLRDQIERRNQLADSGQSNTELLDALSAGIRFETIIIEFLILHFLSSPACPTLLLVISATSFLHSRSPL